MSITIKINTDNAAFDNNKGRETARILREVAEKIESGEDFCIRDYNGNAVGSYKWEESE